MSDLKSYFDRINRLIDERDGINTDIADIYQEVKSGGYVPKILRKVVSRHRADPTKLAEEDALQETYEAALDGKTKAALAELRSGTTFDATAEKIGIPRRTVARLAETVPKNQENGTAPAAEPDLTIPSFLDKRVSA